MHFDEYQLNPMEETQPSNSNNVKFIFLLKIMKHFPASF